MNQSPIYLGGIELKVNNARIEGQFVELDGEMFYRISNYSQMPDFFMTIVSDSDHWMFISSNGALSAGRKNRDNALFPYYTVDKIHDARGITGSKTCLLIEKSGKRYLWEPFSPESERIYSIQRNLYKSIYNNKIVFEERNLDLGMDFKYGWYNSEKYGFVKKSVLTSHNFQPVEVEVLDGITNLLPGGIGFDFQNTFSNLLDAYKKSELLQGSGLGLFMLSSIPVDQPEPSESLVTTTVWSRGLGDPVHLLLSSHQVDDFVKGQPVVTETDIRSARGAFFVNSSFLIQNEAPKDWITVAEINQENRDVANLDRLLTTRGDAIKNLVEEDIVLGTLNLRKIVSSVDGLQVCNDPLSSARHYSNALFNIMRGGVFTHNYQIDQSDFIQFVRQKNQEVFARYQSWLEQLPDPVHLGALISQADDIPDSDLQRICHEYLPLTFSRRHGDPSRPWNLFSIETKKPDGSVKLNYEGNWRDIFQNWEALGLSFPEFLESMITKFLNSSTADGYNPYRITREGIDWESPDPHDPWAYIGYWGDHQIIYLLKLLELSHDYHPGQLSTWWKSEMFAYANVPYRLKSFSEIVKNPKDTILFDFERNDAIAKLVQTLGADGALLRGADHGICKANLTEKVLVSLLAKLSNFVPEAGIWLNTQRPEWNDANNALVGNGASMVTLYYLRRFLHFWSLRLMEVPFETIRVSNEVHTFFDQVYRLLDDRKFLLKTGFSPSDRQGMITGLGEAGSTYRNMVYENAFSGRTEPIFIKKLVEFALLALEYMDQSIRVNKRSDGLYHAYNLISFTDGGIAIRHLYEMLEGQVAVLSSGYLSVSESLSVLDSLRGSKLFRSDQQSYLLYPNRQLPLFTRKNNIPEHKVFKSRLLRQMVAENDPTVINADDHGNFYFNSAFRNSRVLENALNELDPGKYACLLSSEKEMLLSIYEELFDHQSFTGRSGTFYGYEGLGSIYWHMVSKLLLAVQEVCFKAVAEKANGEEVRRLKQHYYEIKAGIGVHKPPRLYGAFPTDPYSHTPENAGAQQPGMTGQVKEDFISRMRELGVHVSNGEISFQVSLLNPEELLDKESRFEYFDVNGQLQHVGLKPGQMAFTYCQVPVIYSRSNQDKIVIKTSASDETEFFGHVLDNQLSAALFRRSHEIQCIEVFFKEFSRD